MRISDWSSDVCSSDLSLDTGWSSGRIALKDGAGIELNLTKPGDNTFKVFVFDSNGGPVSLREDKIVIARTAASIDAIPASHSVGVEARDKVGGRLRLDYLVREIGRASCRERVCEYV